MKRALLILILTTASAQAYELAPLADQNAPLVDTKPQADAVPPAQPGIVSGALQGTLRYGTQGASAQTVIDSLMGSVDPAVRDVTKPLEGAAARLIDNHEIQK